MEQSGAAKIASGDDCQKGGKDEAPLDQSRGRACSNCGYIETRGRKINRRKRK